MSSLGLPLLIVIFAGCAAVIWVAGIRLSDTTDVLDNRLHLGSALGGVVLLAIATNLPEIAITVAAAASGNIGVATGNILGGIAIQTVVLVALDAFSRDRRSLSYRAASLSLVLEAGLVIAVLTVAVMGSQLPHRLHFGRVAPASMLITVLWLAGVLLLSRARGRLPWQEAGEPPDGQPQPRGHAKAAKDDSSRRVSTARAAVVFSLAAALTLAAGYFLEQSGEHIAGHIGLTGVLFGSTVLAAATSLPELSTGLASVRLGDVQLAMSDIFGGNAFLPVLFLVATLIAGTPALPQAQPTDIYLTGLGMLLTVVYIFGLVFRPRRTVLRMGPDSLAVLALYGLGVAGLVAIAA
jgi:cation:H+ antiporter